MLHSQHFTRGLSVYLKVSAYYFSFINKMIRRAKVNLPYLLKCIYFVGMERRIARVSKAQWVILLDFLERNPRLGRTGVYNNSAKGRAESSRLWKEVTELLNAERTGTTKTPKNWSIVSITVIIFLIL